MKDNKFHLKWKGFMVKAENMPCKVWLYLGLMFIAMRLPEVIEAIAKLIHQ